MTFDDLKTLAVLSLRAPERAIAGLRALDIPMSARWTMVPVVAALMTILSVLAQQLIPAEVSSPLTEAMRQAMSRPLMVAAVQAAGLVVSAFLMFRIGQTFGGAGNFADSLLVVLWIQGLLLGLQALQLAVMVLFPLVSFVLELAITILFIYLPVRLSAALHGFHNLFLVFLGVVAGAFMLIIILVPVVLTLGILPELPANDL